MTEYQLPMKDGKVDWSGRLLSKLVGQAHHLEYAKMVKVLKAIEDNARAEERKRCEDVCETERKRAGCGTDGAWRLGRAILAIRALANNKNTV